MLPNNLTLTVAGAGLLWVGWFGFNPGSALAANGLAVSPFVATNLGAAAASLSWVAAEWCWAGKPTTLGAASGAVAGLVAITPASGFVSPMPAMIIGLVAGILCYGAVRLKPKFGYDDALDVVGVHGVGGTWGALVAGTVCWLGRQFGGRQRTVLWKSRTAVTQAIAVASSISFAFSGSLVLLKITDSLVGLRVDDDAERLGLDLSQHDENAYTLEA